MNALPPRKVCCDSRGRGCGSTDVIGVASATSGMWQLWHVPWPPRSRQARHSLQVVCIFSSVSTEVPFTGHEGQYVSMPPRNVVPKPVQKPHPPLWVACSRRETILLVAELGIGALTFAFIDPEEAVHWVSDYFKTLEEKGAPIGRAINPEVSCVTPMMVARIFEESA